LNVTLRTKFVTQAYKLKESNWVVSLTRSNSEIGTWVFTEEETHLTVKS
jgi:hypothetical protein